VYVEDADHIRELTLQRFVAADLDRNRSCRFRIAGADHRDMCWRDVADAFFDAIKVLEVARAELAMDLP